MGFNVAIDGPAGAGKSTVAKEIAKQEGFIYVDTGAMYRAIGLYILRKGIALDNENEIGKILPEIAVTLGYEDGKQQVFLNGENVSGLIRTEEVSNAASVTSQYPAVREALLNLQHDMAKKFDVVMDGRDIGSVILPNADLKIFLTASVQVRAERRMLENREKGIECSLEEIEKDIADRDYRDTHRAVSPLIQAEDAILVDTSHMDIEQVVSKISEMIHAKQKGRL